MSPKAVKRLAELQGKECHFYEGGISKPYTRVEMRGLERGAMFWSAFTIGDADIVNSFMKPGADWRSLTHDEMEKFNKLYNESSLDRSPKDRTDKLLIQVIEELGRDANGGCAELKIVEIPDGVEYEICEYDGNEHIAEMHRTWG